MRKTLTGYVRCHSEQTKKKASVSQTVFLKSTNAAYTHTDRQTHTHPHTDDDSIRRNAMRCISPKNDIIITSDSCDEHLSHIYYVLERLKFEKKLKFANLTARASETQFARDRRRSV